MKLKQSLDNYEPRIDNVEVSAYQFIADSVMK